MMPYCELAYPSAATEQPLNGTASHLQCLRYFPNRRTRPMHFRRTVTIKYHAFPSQDLALSFCVSNPGTNTFTNKLTFKLGHRCQDMQQKPCRGIGVARVDALGHCEKPNTVRTKRRYSVKTIAIRTSEPVQFVNQNGIKTA